CAARERTRSMESMEEVVDLVIRAEHMHLLARFQRFQALENGSAPPRRVVPDPSKELEAQALVAALGHLGAMAPPPGDLTAQHTSDALPARHIEEENRVAARQALFEGAAIVSIDDPPLAGQKLAHDGQPFVIRALLPIRKPVIGVEMDER